MERGVFDILLASPEGRALIWPSIEKERAAWAREREAWARERAAWAREREAAARGHGQEVASLEAGSGSRAATAPRAPAAMERGVFDILLASPEGRALIWPIVEKKRALPWGKEPAWSSIENERAAWARERETLARLLQREIDSRERERAFLVDREATAIAGLHRDLDFSNGLVTVGAALEGIVTYAFPGKPAADALRLYCEQPRFQSYLAAVSAASGISAASLALSAKEAFGTPSQAIHGGGSTRLSADETAAPQAILRDKSAIFAVAAIFRLERRDMRYYVGRPSVVPKLPSPPRSAAR